MSQNNTNFHYRRFYCRYPFDFHVMWSICVMWHRLIKILRLSICQPSQFLLYDSSKYFDPRNRWVVFAVGQMIFNSLAQIGKLWKNINTCLQWVDFNSDVLNLRFLIRTDTLVQILKLFTVTLASNQDKHHRSHELPNIIIKWNSTY